VDLAGHAQALVSVPASRARASSWAWSSAFSAIAASSLVLASASSTMIRLRCSFWEVVTSPQRLKPRARPALTATMTR
jgi:hypothetical protein